VIGSAGSDDKVQYLLETTGVYAAFNYKVQDTRVELDRYAKDGLDTVSTLTWWGVKLWILFWS